MDFYYCGIFSYKSVVPFILLILLIILLLRLLSTTADEFFCICLESMVIRYNISPNTAGVTFLSFGNGSIDVFSLIIAFIKGSYEMGVGGNIGAALFITTVVVSLVLLRGGTIELNMRPFLRDTFFLIVLFFLFLVIIIIFISYFYNRRNKYMGEYCNDCNICNICFGI